MCSLSGIFATHGVFQLQLIVDNKPRGIHHFIVPIRDPETYKTFPGITAGDIGPKMAYKSKDNGFLLF
jgi:acyl-CoA oxidase